MKNNMEDLHTDVWAKRVKITPTVHKQSIIMYTKKLRASDSLKTCAFSYNCMEYKVVTRVQSCNRVVNYK